MWSEREKIHFKISKQKFIIQFIAFLNKKKIIKSIKM